MKVHFAYVEHATESDNTTYWSETICGYDLDDIHLTDNKKFITCKKCLNQLAKNNKR